MVALRARMDSADDRLPVAELLEAVLNETGYMDALQSERTIEAEGRVENLQELVGVAGEFDANRAVEGFSDVGPLEEFLRDPARRTLDWPVAEPRRQHLHGRINAFGLPVSHQTRRQGRPYTLVLTKTSTLFERERQVRARDESNLGWLTTAW